MNFWLIQRGLKRTYGKKHAKGVDKVVQWDYMGSAEFEWGALPKSLKEIRSLAERYEVYKTGLHAKDGRGLMVLCLPEVKEDVVAFLERNAEKRTDHLKELMFLDNALRGDNSSIGETCVWWDVDNHWVACLGEKFAKEVFDAFLEQHQE